MRYSKTTTPATIRVVRPANDIDEGTPDEIMLDFDGSSGTLRIRKDEMDVKVPAGEDKPVIDGGNF